jgi:S-adenosylmethionine:tRNA ribosyltransferase-isomerase
MKLSDFDFDLPERLIALRPAHPRSASRLLVARGSALSDHRFADLPEFLLPGDRLVLNNTQVIPARLTGQRRRISDQGETWARIEVTLLSCDTQGHWLVLAKPAKRLRVGEDIVFGPDFVARVLEKTRDGLRLDFNLTGAEFDARLAAYGTMPLPPYIAGRRAADRRDDVDYQTVFARVAGAVAAPTASLHFDEPLIARLTRIGVRFTTVTLHVGAGTFLPVQTDDISAHRMHAEWGEVTPQAAAEIADTKAAGGRVIPVGTTALRLIETAARASGVVAAWTGETDIFIRPGFDFKVTDGLITNFHLPKSTLLMLVSALMGTKNIPEIYAHAIARNYRFFSYGDASLLLPETAKNDL